MAKDELLDDFPTAEEVMTRYRETMSDADRAFLRDVKALFHPGNVKVITVEVPHALPDAEEFLKKKGFVLGLQSGHLGNHFYSIRAQADYSNQYD